MHRLVTIFTFAAISVLSRSGRSQEIETDYLLASLINGSAWEQIDVLYRAELLSEDSSGKARTVEYLGRIVVDFNRQSSFSLCENRYTEANERASESRSWTTLRGAVTSENSTFFCDDGFVRKLWKKDEFDWMNGLRHTDSVDVRQIGYRHIVPNFKRVESLDDTISNCKSLTPFLTSENRRGKFVVKSETMTSTISGYIGPDFPIGAYWYFEDGDIFPTRHVNTLPKDGKPLVTIDQTIDWDKFGNFDVPVKLLVDDKLAEGIYEFKWIGINEELPDAWFDKEHLKDLGFCKAALSWDNPANVMSIRSK